MRLQTRSGKETGKEVRVTVPGHTQRGGSPCPYDRVLPQDSVQCSAGDHEGEYGYMVGKRRDKGFRLEECAGKLKMVSPKGSDQSSQTDRYQLRTD